MFTGVAFKIECVLIATFFLWLALCWLCENRRSIVVEVRNAIFLIKNARQVMCMHSTVINEDPVVEEPELVVSPSFPVYNIPSPQRKDNTDQAIEEVMVSIMRIVDLTIRREKTVESCLNYFKFVFFDLQLGKEMYPAVKLHVLDQLDWWHYCIGDSQLEIVGELFGALIVQGIKLNLSDFEWTWKLMADKVFDTLEYDKDMQSLIFAQSAFKQLKKDLPPTFRGDPKIQKMIGLPQTVKTKTKKIVLTPWALSCDYL